MDAKLRIEGAILGCLVGNALGKRCMGKKQTRATVLQQLARQYSEAGAMTLCTMSSLIDSERFDSEDVMNRFHEWYVGSYMASTEKMETRVNVSQALRLYINGMPPDRCGAKTQPVDNSSLMRMLPIALWSASDPIESIVKLAHEASLLTNKQIEAQVCSALYCLIIRRFLLEQKERVTEILENFYAEKALTSHQEALGKFQDYCKTAEPTGDSEAFNALWTMSSTFAKNSKSFEDALSKVIVLGNDCEVSGYLVGSLAGVALGVNDIPQRWINQLHLPSPASAVISAFAQIIRKRL